MIPDIPQYEIQYDPHNSVNNVVPAYFSLDSTVVQMAPSSWTAPSDTVFNGWYVVDASDASGYLSDAAGNHYRIMPGDGIKLIDSGSMSYDETDGVLNVPRPTDATQPTVVLEAQWDEPVIKYVKSASGGSKDGSFDNPYPGINGALVDFRDNYPSGTLFTNIIKIIKTDNDFSWGTVPGAKDGVIPTATIIGINNNQENDSSFRLNITTNISVGNFYFDHLTLINKNTINVGSRLIFGENVKTTINTGDWYFKTNNGVPSTFKIIPKMGTTSHLVILGGTYESISGMTKGVVGYDSYICVGSSLSEPAKPNIFSVYGGDGINENGGKTGNSHILVNSGTVMEIIGGCRAAGLKSTASNIEITGGYVSYVNGGPRSGSAQVGLDKNDTAVQISILGGTVDYIFSGAKDGNPTKVDTAAPVYGNVEINILGGDIYAVFGGGYDFWNDSIGYGVIGNIFINIVGGTIGTSTVFNPEGGGNPGNLSAQQPNYYYSKEPGVYGGGYRGSVLGNVTISIGNSVTTGPIINGNIYGGGSGGIDESGDNSDQKGPAKNDTTGQSYIVGNVKVVIGKATIEGDVFGGGKGVSKSSYYRVNRTAGGFGYALEIVPNGVDVGNANVATVFGTTTVQIQNGASISGNIFGAGRGISKSVFIDFDQTTSSINSALYNMSSGDIKYQWETTNLLPYAVQYPKEFKEISGETSPSLLITNELNGQYIRLKITSEGETIYSNVVMINEDGTKSNPLIKDVWNDWNTELSQIATVTGGSTVNILGGIISKNVYGGGAYGIVGENANPTPTGSSNVTIQAAAGTIIKGNVFGGGKGIFSTNPDALNLGSIYAGTNVVVSGTPLIEGNVFGGGELAIVGTYTTTLNGDLTADPSEYSSMQFTGGSTSVNISGGTISKNVYGGGEGSPNNIISGIVGETQVIISGADTKINNVYGGGSYASVGNATVNLLGEHYVSDSPNNSSTEVYILGGKIAGSVFGAGYGKQSFVAGNTNVIVGISNTGIASSDITIAGNIFGGGEMGAVGVVNKETNKVYNDGSGANVAANVTIRPNGHTVTIGTLEDNLLKNGTGNVFGAGKGLSKSVYITHDPSNHLSLNSYLYNMLDNSYQVVDYYSGVSTVSSCRWIVTSSDGTPVTGSDNLESYKLPDGFTGTAYLEVTTSDNEVFSSNTLSFNNGVFNTTTLSKEAWENEISEYVTIAQVAGSANVTISGGNIYGNVFGGGSYGAVGIVVDVENKIVTNNPDSPYNDPSYDPTKYDYHEISGGNTSVTISGGTIGILESSGLYTVAGTGNVFGGGMGEPATITAGSVGGSTTVNIREDPGKTTLIRGSVYGGGENGSVGDIVLSIDKTHMHQVPATNGALTNTYYFDLRVIGSLGDSTNKIGYTEVNIRGGTFAGQVPSTDDDGKPIIVGIGNIFGGGYGLNASVIGFTNVKVTGGEMDNIYGGGELGIVGNIKFDITDAIPKLTNGETHVTITGSEISKVIINGSVYGGGKGLYSDKIVEIILGAVGSATHVTIDSDKFDSLNIHGSVYGGGELGIVGSYYLVWDDNGTDNHDDDYILQVIFNGDLSNDFYLTPEQIAELKTIQDSNTYVTITGGTIWQNVYGGGKGRIGTDNLYSGAVGNTTVNIAGEATYHREDDYVSSGKLIIGKSNLAPLDSRGLSTTSEVQSGTDSNSIFPSEQPVPGNVFVNARNPEHGTLIITNEAGDLQIPLVDGEYDTYTFTPGSKYLVTYEVKAESGHHVSTWYNVDNNNFTITTAQFTVPNDNTTIWVKEDNHYYVNVVKPSFGRIDTVGPDGKEPIPVLVPGDNLRVKAYCLEYGTKLTLNYLDYPTDTVDSFIKVWTTAPLYDILASGNLSTADFTVGGDVRITTLQGPAIGNVYGGGAYGIVGSAQILKDFMNDTEDRYEPHSSENNGKVTINIFGGLIGADNAGSLATGNIFGGGYGPSAYILGSTYINIGTSTNDQIKSDIGILGNVYGGGEMGSVGYAVSGNLDATGEKDGISTNISIKSDVKERTIKIGSSLSDNDHQKQFTDLWGNIFGGGQGGELPKTENLKFNFDHGYAVVRGKTFINISGVETNTTPPSNVIIGGNVFGGGEGILRDDKDNTSFDPYSFYYGKVTGVYYDDPNKNINYKDATHIHLDKALVRKSVFGGGKLGVVGDVGGVIDYITDSNGNSVQTLVGFEFIGKETRIYIDGRVTGNVFGGGEGDALNAIAGATGDTMIVIAANAKVGALDDTGKPLQVIGPSGLTITSGNVYGGGRIAITGDFAVGLDLINLISNSNTTKDNRGQTMVVVIGGEIYNSVYGGGFSPKATIAGSTAVYIGDFKSHSVNINANFGFVTGLGEDISIAHIKISGSVYGGGEMGAVGTTVLLAGEEAGWQLDTNKQVNGKWVSTNVFVTSKGSNINIEGNVFGGGQGIMNSELSGIAGYAVVRGNTNVQIAGDANDAGKVTIYKVYGGGQGVQGDVYSVLYGEVYDATSVTISDATIKDSVYGGGEFGIIGHFTDSYPTTGSTIKFLQNNKVVTGTVTETDRYDENGAPLYELSYTDETGSHTMITTITIREFCGDDAQQIDGGYGCGPKAYTGQGTTEVTITDSQIGGSVYGGGRGVEISVLAGAVGRGTTVSIEDTSCNDTVDPNHKTMIAGSVYGGGKLGIVGSVTTQIIGTALFSQVKIIHAAHVSDLQNFTPASANLDKQNDVDAIVNIFGGHIKGSVFGAGKGEELRIEGADYGDAANAYYKLSVFGRTEVNITNGVIDKHVFGGSEEGDTGSFTVLQYFQKFTDWYWQQKNLPFAHPSNIPVDDRDNFYEQYVAGHSSMPAFSASFVNVVGGTIHGNVFGGGYFGASHGNVHVHIGWNAVKPYTADSGTTINGDCHYYNDHQDSTFVENNERIKDSKPVSDLIINGSVYAGSDRGDPNATELNYDFISIYGTAHTLINGTGYATGTDITALDQRDVLGNQVNHVMYLRGSIFGSGNSCSTFFTDKDMSRFIYITNYRADETSKFVIYSIQRATEVNLINSVIRLPGRSNGANVNKTALYSLNHVNKLTLQSGSNLILDTIVQDVRELYSLDGTRAQTTMSLPINTIVLNNGISLTIQTDKNHELSTQAEGESWPDKAFGLVSGYFFLDMSDVSYYSAYVYGNLSSTGGFVYGDSFATLSGGEVPYKNYTNDPQYRAWQPAGGNHLGASSTIVAEKQYGPDGNETNHESLGYHNIGKLVLPMTESGSKFKLIGYNIYPAQAAKLGDQNASLRLIDGNVSFDSSLDPNRFFKLKISMGNGFKPLDSGDKTELWLTDEKGNISGSEFIAAGGSQLPEINLDLYSNGVTQTTTAGYVVLFIQESVLKLDADGKPLLDENNQEIYVPGKEIAATINIETQADGFGETTDNKNYENGMNLYATREGQDEWNLSLSNINNEKYQFELADVSVSGGITLIDGSPTNLSTYKIIMSHTFNNDNSNGWDGFSFEPITLLKETPSTVLGQTDGRFNTSFNFVIYNKENDTGYQQGTVTLTIYYYKLSTKTAASTITPVLSAADTPDGTITIVIKVGEQKPWYNVSFEAAPNDPTAGVGAIATQQVTFGESAVKPVPDPTRLDNKYVFDNWYRSYDEVNKTYSEIYPFDGSVNSHIESDTTLYGKWVSAVTFNYNYEGAASPAVIKMSETSGSFSEVLNKMPDPTQSGYVFGGWYKDASGTTPIDGNYPIDKNTTVYAKWDVLNYAIHFEGNLQDIPYDQGIEVPEDTTANESGVVTLNDPDPKELNSTDGVYRFNGWATSKSALSGYTGDTDLSKLLGTDNVKIDETDPTKATVTLYAVWVKSPVITVNTDPLSAGKYVNFEYFVGDTTSADTQWESVTEGAFAVNEGSTVHIRYTINTSGYEAAEAAGWSYGGATADASTALKLDGVNTSIAVTLRLNAKQISVTLDPNGGSLTTVDGQAITSPMSVTFGGTYDNLADPTRLGYEFVGWYDKLTNGNKITNSSEVTNPQPHTLYALWKAKSYNIVFYENNGNSTAYRFQSFTDYQSGMSITLNPNQFTVEGKIFKGWTDQQGGTSVKYSDQDSITLTKDMVENAKPVEVSGTTIPNVVLELYAVWEVPELIIELYHKNDTALETSITEVTFDGYNWQERIGILDKDILIKAYTKSSDGTRTEFNLDRSDSIVWKENNIGVSPNRMINKGTYTLTVTCERNEGNVIKYHGETNLKILPYTGIIGMTLNPNEYVYNGQQPNVLSDNTTLFLDSNGDGTQNTGEIGYRYYEIMNLFDVSYQQQNVNGNLENATNHINAGKYQVSLTAKSDTNSNFYNADITNNNAAGGSAKFTIKPYTDTIYIEVKDNLVYAGSDADQNPIKSVYGSSDTNRFEIWNSNTGNYGDLTSLFEISYAKKDSLVTLLDIPTDADSYVVTLTARNTATNFYMDTTYAADGSANYEIAQFAITIKPAADQWKFYGDENGVIYSGNYVSGTSKPDTKLKYTTLIKNADGSETEITLGSGEYANYAQIQGDLSVTDLAQFSDVGNYDFNLGIITEDLNHNYKITLDTTIPFEVKKLPIFIVPLENQWKYYGYDLTNPENVDLRTGACIFIGDKNNLDKPPSRYDSLQYHIYDYRNNGITNAIQIPDGKFTEDQSGYRKLNGSLYSEMLNSATGVDTTNGYTILIGTISNLNNPNYVINYYDKPNTANSRALGADVTSIPSSPPTAKIVKRPVTVVWAENDFTYTGANQLESIKPTFKYSEGSEDIIGPNALKISLSRMTESGGTPTAEFLIAGTYTATVTNDTDFNNYEFKSEDLSKEYNLKQAPLTITFNGSAEYNGTNLFEFDNLQIAEGATGNITASGLLSGDYITKIKINTSEKDAKTYTLTNNSVTVSVSAREGNANDRSNCYVVNLYDNSTIRITPKEVKVIWNPSESNFEYTGNNQSNSIAATFTDVSSLPVYLTVEFTKNGSPAEFKDAGEYTATASIAETDSNYTLDVTTTTHEYTINAATNIHTVNFETNGGNEIEPVAVVDGGRLAKPTDPTKQGYTFKGWYKEDGTEWNFDEDTVTSDITLYAKWEAKENEPGPTYYRVEYDANGGEGEVPKTELHFAGVFVTVKSSELSKQGYTFMGWCDSFTQTTYLPDEEFRMPSRNVCLTAIWEESKPPLYGKEVSVTFIVDNKFYGESRTHINTELGRAMQPDPVKEGYDFTGWYDEQGNIFTADTIVKDNMTVYAEFELNEDYVIVTFVIDNEVYLEKVCRKDNIQEPYVPYKLGKELNAWYADKELQNKFSFDTIVSEDHLTLYAEWKDNADFLILMVFFLFAVLMAAVIASSKRVAFFINENDEEKYASAIIIGKGTLGDKFPQSPDNANFLGWYTEQGEQITAETKITQSMKVYARWKE